MTNKTKKKSKPAALPPPDGYLTAAEAGAVLRLKARRIAYLVSKKKLRSAKIGGRRLFKRVDLDTYVEANMSDAKVTP